MTLVGLDMSLLTSHRLREFLLIPDVDFDRFGATLGGGLDLFALFFVEAGPTFELFTIKLEDCLQTSPTSSTHNPVSGYTTHFRWKWRVSEISCLMG